MADAYQQPSVSLNGDLPLQYTTDQEGYYLKRTSQVIEYQAPNRATIYFSVYKNLFKSLSQYNSGQISYTIKIVSLGNADCSKTCYNNGICQNRVCDCPDGYFGQDCLTPISVIESQADNSITNLPTQARTFTYFAIAPSVIYNTGFYIQTYAQGMVLLVNFNQNQKDTLPIFDNSYNKVPVATGNNFMEINYVNSRRIIFGIWNNDFYGQSIKISWAPDTSSSSGTTDQVIPAIMIVFLILMIPLILLCLCKVLRRCQGFGRVSGFTIGNSTPQEEEIPAVSKKRLTPELIEQVSEKMSFQDLHNDFEQPSCVICLDDFKATDMCRELCPCRHVFHLECIDSWLLKSSKCPTCNGRLSQSVPGSRKSSINDKDENIKIEVMN